ncbi:MAG TPA: hypothetical protein VH682_23555 [Gemmataceae bacterium]|jgi:hypothetical protein
MRLVSLLLSTVLMLVARPVSDQDIYVQSTGKKCGMEGNAKSTPAKALDRLKNRYTAPTSDDMDNAVSLAALLAPGDDLDRFDATKGAGVVGLVLDVKVGGKETCNCRATAAIDRDSHIELALAKDAPEIQRVIVEVTPRLRAQMKAKKVDWTTDALRARLKGKWVKVTGWLLFDSQHIAEAENTNPGGSKNWRATCWEIHPVTNLEVLTEAPSGVNELAPNILKEFHRIQAAQRQRDAKQREALKARNQKILAGFDKEDLDEDLPER